MKLDDYLNTRQAAAYLQISASTLNKLRVYGDGPPFVKIGRSVRYRRSDLDVWAATCLRKSTSDDGHEKLPRFTGAGGEGAGNRSKRSMRPPKRGRVGEFVL